MKPGIIKVAVVDGQGGGIGKVLVAKLKQGFPEAEILAFGTNSSATYQMMGAGADEGATGENAILVNMGRVDVIVGAVGIVAANSMLGEMTPAMAAAISGSMARKILLPVNKCNLCIVGLTPKTANLSTYIEEAVMQVKKYHREMIGRDKREYW